MQLELFVCPDKEEYIPAAHFVGVLIPAFAQYVPAGHSTACVAPIGIVIFPFIGVIAEEDVAVGACVV